MARGRLSLLLLLRLKPIPTMALTDTVDFPTEATDALTEATDILTDSLLTVATDVPTEATVATLVATGPMEATMARGRLSLLLLLRLKPIPTMALTDTVDFPTEATDALTEATGVLTDSPLTVATDVPTEDMVATDVVTTARERPRLPLRLRLMLTTATVTDAATEVTGSLHTVATDASMEDMVATDVVTTERGRLRPLLRLMLTTATVTDAATEAMDVLTVFLLMVVMAALTEDMEATDVATTERGRLRLPLRLMLRTDTATDAATDALTVMATESRQQPEHPTPHEQPRIAQYELNKKQVLDLLYLDPLRVI